VVTNTKSREFDYPLGDENVFAVYEGSDGIKLSNIIRKAAFSIRLGSLNLLISSAVTKDSKVLIMQSPGVPGKVKGSVNSGVYYIGSVGDLPDTTAEIKIRLDEESANATIMGWDGTDWIQYNTSVDGKTASAKGNLVSTYVVVK